jgi:hypothetical protein
MLSTGPILNGGGSSLTGGLSVEKCRGMELVKLDHCSDVEWENWGSGGWNSLISHHADARHGLKSC